MINKSHIAQFLTLSIAGIAFFVGSAEVSAQTRDPFSKPGWARKRENPVPGSPGKAGSGPVVNLGIPSIQSRIDFYKRIRESAALNGQPLPKVTSVLSLSEMAVTGIFKTPRGYAAMVEAVPIKLSYTIYPGEKFFDGQLVAVEENRLVFRKVTKTSNNKFVTSVEHMALRKYSDQQQLQGTAPVESDVARREEPRPSDAGASGTENKAPVAIVSPLDEMNKQVSAEKPKADKSAKKNDSAKKPVKVAKKNR
jgi:hypothetical protein